MGSRRFLLVCMLGEETLGRQYKKSNGTNEKGRIILAISDEQILFTMSSTIEKMGVSFSSIAETSELEEILSQNGEVLGAIIEREFLGADAQAALNEIKNIAPKLPIVLAVSDTDLVFEKIVRQIGVYYYLLRPYERKEFLDIVRALQSRGSA